MSIPEEHASNINTSAALDEYMYLNASDPSFEGHSINYVLNTIGTLPDYQEGGAYAKEYQRMTQIVENNSEIGNMIVSCQSQCMTTASGGSYNSGTAACAFTSANGNDVYIAFRGTGTGEWVDNGNGLSSPSSPQQDEALEYFNQTVEALGITSGQNFYVTGHSKGGNKAQFCTIMSEYNELIDNCYSFDGQGFSNQFISRYGDTQNFRDAVDKMYAICGKHDYVHVLGNVIIPQDRTTYLEYNGISGIDIAGYHDIYYLFNDHGSLNDSNTTVGQGALARYISALSQSAMNLSPQTQHDVFEGLMGILEYAFNQRLDGMHGQSASPEELVSVITTGLPIILGAVGKQLAKDITSCLIWGSEKVVDFGVELAGHIGDKTDEVLTLAQEGAAHLLYSAFQKGSAVGVVSSAMLYVGATVLNVADDIVFDVLVPAIGAVTKKVLDGVEKLCHFAIDCADFIFTKAIDFTHRFILRPAIGVITGVVNGIISGITSAGGFISSVAGRIKAFYDNRSTGGRYRDFTEEAYQKLIGFVKDVEPSGFWSKVGDWFGDVGLHVKSFCGFSNINNCLNDIDKYHKEMIDKDDVTKNEITSIFDEVKAIDTQDQSKISERRQELTGINSAFDNFIQILAISGVTTG